MRKSIIFSLAVLAVMAFTVMPVLAGPSCGSVSAKLGKADKAACSASATTTANKAACSAHATTTANAFKHDCDYKGTCETVSFSVKGMTCGGCENGLTTALTDQKGVVKVLKVSHKENLAVVCFDPTVVKSDALTKMIASKGYEANIIPAVAITANAIQAGAKDGAGCATMSKEDCAKAGKAGKACCASKKTEETKVEGSL